MFRTIFVSFCSIVGDGGDRVSRWDSKNVPLLPAVSGVGFHWCKLWQRSRLTEKRWQENGFLVSQDAEIGYRGARVSGWCLDGIVSLHFQCCWIHLDLSVTEFPTFIKTVAMAKLSSVWWGGVRRIAEVANTWCWKWDSTCFWPKTRKDVSDRPFADASRGPATAI